MLRQKNREAAELQIPPPRKLLGQLNHLTTFSSTMGF